jgi:autotransporter-associated beta strand protein
MKSIDFCRAISQPNDGQYLSSGRVLTLHHSTLTEIEFMKNGISTRGSRILVGAIALMIGASATFAGTLIPIVPGRSGDNIMPVPPVDGGGPGTVLLSTIEWANVGTDWATGTNWSGGTAPANSTATDVASFGSMNGAAVNPVLGTQRSIAGVTFLSGAFSYNVSGSILTIGATGISDSATNTETFSNGIRTTASQTWTSSAGASLVLGGSVDINQNAATTRTLTLNGAGDITFNGVVQNSAVGSTGKLVYSGTGTLTLANANTFTGGTTISSGTVIVSASGSLGTGSVSLTGGSVTLTLSGASQIASSASLSYVNTDIINLNYSGTDTISGLTVDGVAQAAGVYGAGFINPDNAFFGTGTITVVPEPTTVAMMALGAGLLMGVQRFRRKLL